MGVAQNNELKLRVFQAKTQLPFRTVLPLFFDLNPEYDNDDQRTFVKNVLQGRAVDEDITIKLEHMVDRIKGE